MNSFNNKTLDYGSSLSMRHLPPMVHLFNLVG